MAMRLRRRYKLLSTILLLFAVFAVLAPVRLKNVVEGITENPSLDAIHAIAEGLGLLPSPRIPVTLVRIDDPSFAEWHRPFPFSKSLIAGLVDTARKEKPAAILVDLDISAATSQADAEALENLLAEWSEHDPPLLFPKELSIGEDGKTRPLGQISFDRHFTDGKPLYWVNVLFEQQDDLKIRNWNLWELPEGSCRALLAPQLLHFAYNKGGAKTVRLAEDYIGAREGIDCPKRQFSEIPEWILTLEKSAPIQFSFPRSNTAISPTTIPESGAPALVQLSAFPFAERPVAASALKGRFVIIGNSYADNGDFHDTPIGEMEGMRIIANAVANSPNVIEANSPWKTTAVTVCSMLVGGVVTLLTMALKPLIAGPMSLGFGIAIYIVCNIHWGPVAAHSVIQNGIVIWVLAIAFESLESICRGIFIDGRGWRSFLNG
ncbi:CHASE2 domain-containing protein [Rhizobium leguminosarum]|uniref:CHASE2 domain-containing protein n=1 Tax=Rhizobium leguminosarum TaxID=384 RepID=UPI00027D820C|nr:CHASE2 domain-containing protein [Rhizobium leguminosarum]